MALCTGERKTNGLQCFGTVYKCTECGSVGCKQNKDHVCSEQGFDVLGRCYKCGATGKYEIISADGERAPRKTPSFI